MIEVYQWVNIQYDKVSETLKQNWQAKDNSDSQYQMSALVGICILIEKRGNWKKTIPLQKWHIIIRVIEITQGIPALWKDKKNFFKSIQCTLVIIEHLAIFNISSQMVFLQDVRKEISNCNLNEYW